MGKKLGQASLKVSKTIDHKKQLNNTTFINILRPKVYITHSSTFKTLVQQLTGNGSPTSSPPPPPPPPLPQPLLEDQPNYQDHSDCYYYSSSTSLNYSPDDLISMPAALDYSPEIISQPISNHEMSTDFSQYDDIESWLLDYNYDGYVPTIQPEVFGYDYDLSGLI